MTRRRTRFLALALWIGGIAATATPLPTLAQPADTFTARLAWVPTAGVERVTGKGAAVASLTGTTLTLRGSFEGLAGPATVARLHQGVAKGARGRAIADLAIPKDVSGTFNGTVTLTADQVGALRQGRLYVQLHSDKGVTPDGANLWGWFLR